MEVLIRRLTDADRGGWDELYIGYADFYRVSQTAQMRDRVWGWLTDPSHEEEALVAERHGRLVGLAHFRPFSRPLAASVGGYLDDLFVDPEARGSGAAAGLLRAVAEEGRRRGWTVIRWITAENNRRARRLYDREARLTGWRTYDIPL